MLLMVFLIAHFLPVFWKVYRLSLNGRLCVLFHLFWSCIQLRGFVDVSTHYPAASVTAGSYNGFLELLLHSDIGILQSQSQSCFDPVLYFPSAPGQKAESQISLIPELLTEPDPGDGQQPGSTISCIDTESQHPRGARLLSITAQFGPRALQVRGTFLTPFFAVIQKDVFSCF